MVSSDDPAEPAPLAYPVAYPEDVAAEAPPGGAEGPPPRPGSPPSGTPELATALRELFGFPSFRPGQEDLARRALRGQSTLAVMPTGSGKSLCYQLPAMLRPTPTLVVSPLIALMKDQIEHLPPAVRARATFINSSLEAAEAAARLREVTAGRIQLLYTAPERLRQARFAEALQASRIGLVVVDEAHCVALWGHDFRPDYLFLRSILAGPLREAAVLALTATATPQTAEDIRQALGRPMDLVRGSVVRENLRYEVVPLRDEAEKLAFTLSWARACPGASILYVRARQRCERLAEALRGAGIAAAAYHAGLERQERAATQEAFGRGALRVVVATTAFGMGVDKPDIRGVLLYNYPTSLEEFVQQVGRAGRDGHPSNCVLLATDRDASNLRRFARQDTPTVEELRRVWAALRRASRAGGRVVLAAEELKAALPEGKDPRVHVGVLERVGLVTRHFDSGPAMQLALLPPPPDAAERIGVLIARVEREALERVRRLVAFAETARCRHLQVAAHFGDSVAVPCGRCDVCAPPGGPAAPWARPPEPRAQGATILDAVAALPRPLGRRGLVALLRGSAATPPPLRRSCAFGALRAAPARTVGAWVDGLVRSGHLVATPAGTGEPMLRLGHRVDPAPPPGPPPARGRRRAPAQVTGEGSGEGLELVEPLRLWRSAAARTAGVPAYVVLHDRTLLLLAQRRPTTRDELASVPGIGPKRLEAWGDALLALVTSGATRAD